MGIGQACGLMPRDRFSDAYRVAYPIAMISSLGNSFESCVDPPGDSQTPQTRPKTEVHALQ